MSAAFQKLIIISYFLKADEDTNGYLRDTLSLMTAMEARLSSAEETKSLVQVKRSRPKTAGDFVNRRANNAAAKAKEAKDQAAQQWQRRKNYDPLKSMTQARKSKESQNYTDESSDVESAASFTPQRGQYPSNPRVAMIRSDGGRHSLRQKHYDPMTASTGGGRNNAVFRNNVMSSSTNGGRSTSSLSSKEAEFQVITASCKTQKAHAQQLISEQKNTLVNKSALVAADF